MRRRTMPRREAPKPAIHYEVDADGALRVRRTSDGGIVVLNFNRDLPSTKQSNADADNPE
jgi:hypothetical protein